jgi:transposase
MYYMGLDGNSSSTTDSGHASKIADCLRCDFLPECHMASTQIRDRRRTLHYRHLLVRQMVQMKNRISGLLMETGVSYNKQRLHKVGYFRGSSGILVA